MSEFLKFLNSNVIVEKKIRYSIVIGYKDDSNSSKIEMKG